MIDATPFTVFLSVDWMSYGQSNIFARIHFELRLTVAQVCALTPHDTFSLKNFTTRGHASASAAAQQIPLPPKSR